MEYYFLGSRRPSISRLAGGLCGMLLAMSLFAQVTAADEVDAIRQAWQKRAKQNSDVIVRLAEVRRSLEHQDVVRDVQCLVHLAKDTGRYLDVENAPGTVLTPTSKFRRLAVYDGTVSWTYRPASENSGEVGTSVGPSSSVYSQPALLPLLLCIRTQNPRFILDGPGETVGQMKLELAGETEVDGNTCHRLTWQGATGKWVYHVGKQTSALHRFELFIDDECTYRLDIRHVTRPGFGVTPSSWVATNYAPGSGVATDWTTGKILSWKRPITKPKLTIEYPEGMIVSASRGANAEERYFLQSRDGGLVRVSDAEVNRIQQAAMADPSRWEQLWGAVKVYAAMWF